MKEILNDPKFWTDVIAPFLLIGSAFCIAVCLGIISSRKNSKEDLINDSFPLRDSRGIRIGELAALKKKHDRRMAEAGRAMTDGD